VLLQLVGTDIENSLLKYRVSYRHLIFMIEVIWAVDEKLWILLICYPFVFNVQLHVHLKNWTLKLKLLYLRNYISYFNIICKICCANTHIKGLIVWLKSVQPWLTYSIFSRGLFAPLPMTYVMSSALSCCHCRMQTILEITCRRRRRRTKLAMDNQMIIHLPQLYVLCSCLVNVRTAIWMSLMTRSFLHPSGSHYATLLSR